MKRILMLIVLTFTSHIVFGQGKTYTISKSDRMNIVNGSFNYTVDINFRITDAGYGKSASAIQISFSNARITGIAYKNEDGAKVLSDVSFPVATRFQANINGVMILKDNNGTNQVRINYNETAVSDGGLDTYDFTEGDKKRIRLAFGEDVTYNDLNMISYSVELNSLDISKHHDLINQMDKKIGLLNSNKNSENKSSELESSNDEEQNIEKKKEEEDISTRIQNEKVREQEERERNNQTVEDEKRRREEAEKAEKERRLRNQKKVEDHNRKVREQTQRNVETAGALATSSASAIVMLGTIIYKGMGRVLAKDTYYGNQMYGGINFGYSASSIPIRFNSERTTLVHNFSTGNNSYKDIEEDRDSRASTFNMDVSPFLGYEHKYGGGEAFLRIKPGMSLIFDAFNMSYNYGGKVYAGIQNFKLFYEYSRGTMDFSKFDWITSDEYGEGTTCFKYYRQNWGVRISFVKNAYKYERHHIQLGFLYDNIIEGVESEDGNFNSVYYNLDVEKMYNPNKYFRIKGYSFEWVKEHTYKLYLRYYGNYPITGFNKAKISEEFQERKNGSPFIEIGFIRQIKLFF